MMVVQMDLLMLQDLVKVSFLFLIFIIFVLNYNYKINKIIINKIKNEGCDVSCETCDGGTSKNCLTCKGNQNYISQTKECVTSCPPKSFSIKINSSYFCQGKFLSFSFFISEFFFFDLFIFLFPLFFISLFLNFIPS